MIAKAYNKKIYRQLRGSRDIKMKRKAKEPVEFLAWILLDEISSELDRKFSP